MRALAVLACCATGCFSFATSGLGSRFAEEPGPRTRIYVYRPERITMAVRPVHVVIDDTERVVLLGSYAVFEVPAGTYELLAYSTPASQTFVTYGLGPTRWSGAAKVTVSEGAAAFVRLDSQIGAVGVDVVGAAAARDQISQCRLTPGGRVSTRAGR